MTRSCCMYGIGDPRCCVNAQWRQTTAGPQPLFAHTPPTGLEQILQQLHQLRFQLTVVLDRVEHVERRLAGEWPYQKADEQPNPEEALADSDGPVVREEHQEHAPELTGKSGELGFTNLPVRRPDEQSGQA